MAGGWGGPRAPAHATIYFYLPYLLQVRNPREHTANHTPKPREHIQTRAHAHARNRFAILKTRSMAF